METGRWFGTEIFLCQTIFANASPEHADSSKEVCHDVETFQYTTKGLNIGLSSQCKYFHPHADRANLPAQYSVNQFPNCELKGLRSMFQ